MLAHRGIDDASLLALVSGSVVEDLAERSDIDMSVACPTLRGQLDELLLKPNPDTPLHKLAAGFAIAPADLADHIDALLQAPAPQAFNALHSLQGEVLALVAQHMPAVDVAVAMKRRADFTA